MASLPTKPKKSIRASDLSLLESGSFADAEIICGGQTIKIHRSIVCTRCEYFKAALDGLFCETVARQIRMEKQDADIMMVALKFIYGGEIDLTVEAGDKPLLTFCVKLAQTADYLMLERLQESIQIAVGHRCDEILKKLYTAPSCHSSQKNRDLILKEDIVGAISHAYKQNSAKLRQIFVEFVWAARAYTHDLPPIAATFTTQPQFAIDLFYYVGSAKNLNEPIWAPVVKEESLVGCRLCAKCRVAFDPDRRDDGRVYDPFSISSYNAIYRAWCLPCSDGDIIPWRLD